MEEVGASVSWNRETDVLSLMREPMAYSWIPDPFEGNVLACVLWELDEEERETDRVGGIEIVGFLDFESWDSVPHLAIEWQVGSLDPLPLGDLLRLLQLELRKQAKAGAA